MKESHKGLYNELVKKISAAYLKDMSIEIINRYRKKDYGFLAGLGESIGLSSAESDISSLFSRIIQLFHPDKLNKITGDIEEYYTSGNTEGLIKMKTVYLVDMKKAVRTVDYSFDEDSEYFYEEEKPAGDEFSEYDDYEFDERDDAENYDDEFIDENMADDEEYGFIEAVNDLYLGNLEYELSVSDMQNLEGELDLSGFDIDDLSGAEHCVNISVLNLSGNRIARLGSLSGLGRLEVLYLSGNRIENIKALAGLTELRELDISFNMVEDVSILLQLPGLKYVNLVGNPIQDTSVTDKLSERGVMVII